MPRSKKKAVLGLSDTVMAVAAQKENDHAKEEKVSIKQGDVTKCGYTVKEVWKDGRLVLVNASELKIVNGDDIAI